MAASAGFVAVAFGSAVGPLACCHDFDYPRRVGRRWPVIVLVSLLGAAAFARVYGVADALVSFHTSHQLDHATSTRATYDDWVNPGSEPRRSASAESATEERRELEPPVLQSLVAAGYLAAGGENLVIARLLGALFWLIGGALLYALADMLFSPGPALIAAAYFLLLPYTVVASQAFQPDPLMIMLAIAGWFFIVRDDYSPTMGSAMLAGVAAGIAILVKPMCAPILGMLYLSIGLRRDGFLGLFRTPETYVTALFALAPSALYYLPELILRGELRAVFEGRIQPALWRTPEFWYGWRDQLFDVAYGPYVPAVAALALVLAPTGRARATLWGLTLGYLLYGLAFSSQIASHDAYQLQVLPIIGLGLAGLASRGWGLTPRMLRPVIGVAVLGGAVALAYWDARQIQLTAWPRTHTEGQGELIAE